MRLCGGKQDLLPTSPQIIDRANDESLFLCGHENPLYPSSLNFATSVPYESMTIRFEERMDDPPMLLFHLFLKFRPVTGDIRDVHIVAWLEPGLAESWLEDAGWLNRNSPV